MENHDLVLTVVITAHSEGRLLRPTLKSVSRALAELGNVNAELLLVCDNADERTLAEVDRWQSDPSHAFEMRRLLVQLGESGASRNAGARAARGEFVAFVDGDDLVSADYFVGALTMLRSTSSELIVHPEYVVSFGARSLLWRTESTRQHDITYRDIVRSNLWPSSAVTRRSVYLAHPYRSLPPEAGYGPEDWIWNIDTTAAGVAHDTVDGSVFFYRVRETGGVNNRHSVSILPSFDLQSLRRHLPLHAAAAERSDWRPTSVIRRVYSTLRPLADSATRWLSPDSRRLLYQSAKWTARTLTGRGRTATSVPPGVQAHLHAAAEIEPAVSWTAFNYLTLPEWKARDDGYAQIVDQVLEAVTPGGAIVFVPWVGVGGADLVSRNYAKALQDSERFRGRVTMVGTYLEEKTRHELIPEGVRYVHLDERWLKFRSHVRKRLIAQIVVLARPELAISVNCFHFTDAMQAHYRQILDGTKAYATLFAFDRIGDGYPVNPITDDSQRLYLDAIDGLITDNTTTAGLIGDILALPDDRIIVHRQPAEGSGQTDGAAWRDETFTPEHPFRLLWPHRLDEEKRPDTVVAIAAELRRRALPAVVEVWGQQVLGSGGKKLLKELADAGAVYRGPYSGGLLALDVASYHAMLLTSKSEGLPLVLVQALQSGLPVVASAVGGVPDIIVDDETGILTAGPDDVVGFVDAIQRLMRDRELRRRLILAGAEHASRAHSWESFARSVAALTA